MCEWRGTVKVGGYSDGPIPWPVKWKTRNSLILCGDLREAVKMESEIAVAHHWGVSIKTAQKWRRALDVEPYTTGTQWLQHVQAEDNATPARIRELTAAARLVTRRPKPREWKRRMSDHIRLRIQRQGPINPKHRLWSKKEDQLLGEAPDAEIARRLGRTPGAVRSRRNALGIDLRRTEGKPWTRAEERLLGTESDAAIAKRLRRPERGVQLRRQGLGIPCFHCSTSAQPWTEEQDRLLGAIPDRDFALRFGRSLATVQHRRHVKGIPNPAPLRRSWTPEEDALLGTSRDEDVSRLLGRPTRAIERRRSALGIPNPAPKRKFWKPEEKALLGKRPDQEIADLLGCAVRTVVTKRVNLGIRAPD